jgi:DNA-binding MarR family transcriptional regulator
VALLVHIDELPTGCHARTLAGRTGLDQSTISRAVGSLVGLGLVERGADPADGRAIVLALTDDGRAALAGAHRWYGEVLDTALAGWTPGEVAALPALLGRFTSDIEHVLGSDDILEVAR